MSPAGGDGDEHPDERAPAVPSGDLSDGATVLVVDDEQSVVETFGATLEDENYEVRTATNGGEALVELDTDVDVVLLDRRMPGMSGDEVLEHIETWHADCRVVMVTAVGPDVDVVGRAFDEYLIKPVSGPELRDTVEQLLLFDRYEVLLSEYHRLTRKHATLEAAFERGAPETYGALSELGERRAAVREALERTVERFDDDSFVDTFHQTAADEGDPGEG